MHKVMLFRIVIVNFHKDCSRVLLGMWKRELDRGRNREFDAEVTA